MGGSIILRLYAVLSTLALVACQSRMSSSMALPEVDVTAIRALHDQLVENEQAGNWEAVATAFTPDVVLDHANTAPWKGIAGFRAAVDSMRIKIAQLHATPAVIDGRGDLAYVRGSYHEVFTMGESATQLEDSGTYFWVLRKQPNGRWLVAEGVVVSDRPLPTSSGR